MSQRIENDKISLIKDEKKTKKRNETKNKRSYFKKIRLRLRPITAKKIVRKKLPFSKIL
jgi:hypothetical protein